MTSPPLIDTHCHIDFEAFDHDRESVLERALNASVHDIIVPGVAKSSWLRTISVCSEYPQCHLALGLHPIFIDEHQPQHLSLLNKLVPEHKPIAIGEIGLDYFLKTLDKEKQRAFFRKQLVLAEKHQLPVIVHNRKAHDDAIAILREIGGHGGIIHAFNGSIQQAEKYIEMGFLLGFGGMLTYARSSKLRRLVRTLPVDRIVLETDSPDMTVAQHRGKRNKPEYIPLILQAMADIKNMTAPEVARITTQNVQSIWPQMRVGR